MIRFLILLFVPLLSWASDKYRVPAGSTYYISKHGVSKAITNSCSNAVFIPTKTSAEWLAARTNPAPCMSVGDADPCEGASPVRGSLCADGTIYAGSIGPVKYKTTPGNCSDSATPTCSFTDKDELFRPWGTFGLTTGGTSSTDGAANTPTIVAADSANGAAKYCDLLDYAGHTDWFLGAYDENRLLTDNAGSFTGMHTNTQYWSSTETGSNNAWATSGAGNANRGKSVNIRFRCMRSIQCKEIAASWTPQYGSITGYWKLNGAVGGVTNNSSVAATIGSNGTARNADASGMSYVTGMHQQYMQFDGVDSHVELYNTVGEISNYTISFWFKPGAAGTSTDVYHRGNSQNCTYNPKISFTGSTSTMTFHETGCGGTGTIGSAVIGSSIWSHVVVTRAGATKKVFINGSLALTDTVQESSGGSGRATLGRGWHATNGYSSNGTDGSIDDLVEWNVALSDAEVALLYSQQSCR